MGSKEKLSTLTPFGKIAIIGASSGIGLALSKELARPGRKIALVSRRLDELTSIATAINEKHGQEIAIPFRADVRDSDTAGEDLERIAESLGGLDVLIYSTGLMTRIDRQDYDTTGDLGMVSVNINGAVAWMNAAARRFAIARSGTIVGISSVAADRGRSANPVYGATKAFLDTYLEGLRNRIERYGCTVITIKPGPVKTPMTAGLGKLPLIISAEDAAGQIVRHMERGSRVAYIPGQWKMVMFAVKLIPSAIFKFLNF